VTSDVSITTYYSRRLCLQTVTDESPSRLLARELRTTVCVFFTVTVVVVDVVVVTNCLVCMRFCGRSGGKGNAVNHICGVRLTDRDVTYWRSCRL